VSLHWWHVAASWGAVALVLGGLSLRALYRQSSAGRQLRRLERAETGGAA